MNECGQGNWLEERDLAAAAIAGDKAAFGLLMEQLVPKVFPVAYAILQNRSDAEDAVREAVISAMNGISCLRDPEAVRGWFHRIVGNHARGMLRRRRDHVPLDHSHHTMPGIPFDADRSIDIRDSILALPGAHREVVLLYYSGFSTPEVAKHLDRPLGTIKRMLSEAYGMLRPILGPDHEHKGRRREP